MSTKSDWDALPENIRAKERQESGGPPATEELMAYGRGELPAEDAERVAAWLEGNPDVALALSQPFPEDDAHPGDPGYLPEEELSRRWSALQDEIRPKGRVVRFPPMSALAALAASLVIVFAGLYVRERSVVRMLSRPAVLDVTQILDPENGRRGPGGGPRLLNVKENGAVCVLQLSDPSRYEWYRIQLLNAASNDEVWESEPTQPQDGEVALQIRDTSLEPGVYRIEVQGIVQTGDGEIVDSYLVRVPAR